MPYRMLASSCGAAVSCWPLQPVSMPPNMDAIRIASSNASRQVPTASRHVRHECGMTLVRR